MHEKKSHARYYQNLLHRYLGFKPKLTVLSTRDSDFLYLCHFTAVNCRWVRVKEILEVLDNRFAGFLRGVL